MNEQPPRLRNGSLLSSLPCPLPLSRPPVLPSPRPRRAEKREGRERRERLNRVAPPVSRPHSSSPSPPGPARATKRRERELSSSGSVSSCGTSLPLSPLWLRPSVRRSLYAPFGAPFLRSPPCTCVTLLSLGASEREDRVIDRSRSSSLRQSAAEGTAYLLPPTDCGRPDRDRRERKDPRKEKGQRGEKESPRSVSDGRGRRRQRRRRSFQLSLRVRPQ